MCAASINAITPAVMRGATPMMNSTAAAAQMGMISEAPCASRSLSVCEYGSRAWLGLVNRATSSRARYASSKTEAPIPTRVYSGLQKLGRSAGTRLRSHESAAAGHPRRGGVVVHRTHELEDARLEDRLVTDLRPEPDEDPADRDRLCARRGDERERGRVGVAGEHLPSEPLRLPFHARRAVGDDGDHELHREEDGEHRGRDAMAPHHYGNRPRASTAAATRSTASTNAARRRDTCKVLARAHTSENDASMRARSLSATSSSSQA